MKKTPVQTIQRVGIYLLLLLVTGGLVCLPRPAAAGGYLGIRLCLKRKKRKRKHRITW